MINKEQIRQSILCQLRTDRDNAIRSASAAHEAATNEESKAENKYDTRGLEASYLAEGQSRRASELEEEVAVYAKLEMAVFTDETPVRLTALVILEDGQGNRQTLFIGPLSGGLKTNMSAGECMVVTPTAPLGNALIGKFVGDEVAINTAGHTTYYEIIDVY